MAVDPVVFSPTLLYASNASRTMTIGGRLKHLSGGRLPAILACVLAGLSFTFHSPLSDQGSTGSIAGRVRDPNGTLVPGVTIKAIRQEDGKIAQSVSDEAGSYVLISLQPGSFVITAELAGFKKGTHGPVAVTGKERLLVDFRMRLAALDHVDYVLEFNTLDELVAKSDAVAHLIIDSIDSATEWAIGPDSSVMGVLVTARLIEQLKSPAIRGPAGLQFQFLHLGLPSPYRAGQEYVAFLTWSESTKHFLGLAGDVYMLEIADCRVVKTAPLKSVSIGMPLARLIKQLRSLVRQPDQSSPAFAANSTFIRVVQDSSRIHRPTPSVIFLRP